MKPFGFGDIHSITPAFLIFPGPCRVSQRPGVPQWGCLIGGLPCSHGLACHSLWRWEVPRAPALLRPCVAWRRDLMGTSDRNWTGLVSRGFTYMTHAVRPSPICPPAHHPSVCSLCIHSANKTLRSTNCRPDPWPDTSIKSHIPHKTLSVSIVSHRRG